MNELAAENRFDKYNKEHPPKSVRIEEEIWSQIPKPKGAWIVKAIKQGLENQSSTPPNPPQSSFDSERNRLLLFLVNLFKEMNLTVEFPDDEMADLIINIIQTELV